MRAEIDRVDMDTVFRFWQSGEHEILPNEQAPEVYGDEGEGYLLIDGDRNWFTVTDGMTNQYGYNGPVMHNSEFISEGMVERILYSHDYREHYFAVCPVYYEQANDYDGWVIVACKVERVD